MYNFAWNFAAHKLGPIGVSVYLYGQPAVTVVMSALLGEPVTPLMLLGTALTPAGLVISEFRRGRNKLRQAEADSS